MPQNLTFDDIGTLELSIKILILIIIIVNNYDHNKII